MIDESKEDETGNQQNFLCQLALQYVEQKYKCELDRKYKLPKATYKGEPTSQRIKDRSKAAKISEVSDAPAGGSGKKKGKKKGATPSHAKQMPIENKPLPYTVHTVGGAEDEGA